MASLFQNLYGWGLRVLPDKPAMMLDFLVANRRLPKLSRPRTFNEKVLHRKLYDRDPRLPLRADKVLVKPHVASILGPDWIIPTLWCGPSWPRREDQDWPLPYVVKANHGSRWNLYVTTEADQDWEKLGRTATPWLRENFGGPLREWLYGEIKPQLLVEPYVGGPELALPVDYKIFVFGGKALYIQVDTGRLQNHRRCFFNREWVREPFTVHYPLEMRPIAPPQTLERMLDAAERLGAGFSFVRVDFYEVDGRPLFGEMTFYPDSGRGRFYPASYDSVLGEHWII